MTRIGTSRTVNVFVICSHKDAYFLDALVPLLRVPDTQVKPWTDKDLEPGQSWYEDIKNALAEMDVFIPLVSVNFAASEFIRKVEETVAKQRFDNGEIDVLPVLVYKPAKYQCEWLMKLKPRVPPGEKTWADVLEEFSLHDRALAPICDGVYDVVQRARARKSQKPAQTSGSDPLEMLDGERRSKKALKETKSKAYTAEELEKLKKLMNGDLITQNFHGGTFIGPVAAKMKNCTSIINQQTNAERRDLLQTIEREAHAIMAKLPPDKQEEAADNLERFVKEAAAEKPNRKWYSVSAEGLLEASEFVKKFSGDIMETIATPMEKLGKLLWPDFSLPEVKAKNVENR